MKKYILCVYILFFSMASHADFKQGGIDYQNGDFDSAAKHFKEAAEKSDHRAMYALGSMYVGGQGVEQDYKQAYIWFRKASKYGRPDAFYKIGLMYHQGLGLKQNHKKAVRWFYKAAKQGYATAQIMLGKAYKNGAGINKDLEIAYAWLLVAANYFIYENPVNTKSNTKDESSKFDQSQTENVEKKVREIIDDIEEIYGQLSSKQLTNAKNRAKEYVKYRKNYLVIGPHKRQIAGIRETLYLPEIYYQ